MEHVNGWCFRGIYKGGLWEDDLHVSARVIETTDTNTVGLWSTRSLAISTLVNSHHFIGQFDPWSIHSSIVPKSTGSSVFFTPFSCIKVSVISRTVTEDELC